MNKKITPPFFIIHCTGDDKFIDSALDLFEEVIPGCNRVLVPADVGKFKYIQRVPVAGRIEKDLLPLSENPYCIGVIFHSLPSSWFPLLAQLSQKVSILWRGFGYEYYGGMMNSEPHHLLAPIYPRGLLLPKTKSTVKRILRKKWYQDRNFCSVRYLAKSTAEGLIGVNRLTSLRAKLRRLMRSSEPEFITALRRVDFFSSAANIEHDVLSSNYNWFRTDFVHVPYIRENRYEWKEQRHRKAAGSMEKRILVGNSATPEGNHIDVLHLIASNSCFDDFKVIVPLSYGRSWYRDEVIRYGKKLLDERFEFISDFQSKEDYFSLVKTCSHAIMAHLRQQASGNIKVLLAAGAKVAMHQRSLLFQSYVQAGYSICSYENLQRRPEDFASEFQLDLRRSNVLLSRENADEVKSIDLTIDLMVGLWESRCNMNVAHNN